MSPERLKEFISKLPPKKQKELAYTAYYWLRDDQILPEGDWSIAFVRPGRGWGKTRLGAAYMQIAVEHLFPGTRGRLAIVAPTHVDISKTIWDEFKKIYPPGEGPEYVENKNEFRFKNGTTVYSNSSDQTLRGGSLDFVWCDEVVAWCDGIPGKIADKFGTLEYACREGDARFLVTTTPDNFPIFKKWQKQALDPNDPAVVQLRGSMGDNPHLSAKQVSRLEKENGGTAKGRTELDGEIVEDNPFALWTYDDFDRCRVDESPPLRRTYVALDPAVTSGASSDASGIIVGGISADAHGYVLKDASLRETPDVCARRAVDLFHQYEADAIVVEVNNGGDWIGSLIKTIDPGVPVLQVRATKNKETRAQPIASLYKEVQSGNVKPRIHHVGPASAFRHLEDECVTFVPGKGRSPDRMDALVWCMHALFFNSGGNGPPASFRFSQHY